MHGMYCSPLFEVWNRGLKSSRLMVKEGGGLYCSTSIPCMRAVSRPYRTFLMLSSSPSRGQQEAPIRTWTGHVCTSTLATSAPWIMCTSRQPFSSRSPSGARREEIVVVSAAESVMTALHLRRNHVREIRPKPVIVKIALAEMMRVFSTILMKISFDGNDDDSDEGRILF